MSDTESNVTLSWYEPESVSRSIRNGLDRDIQPEKVSEYLAEHGFDDIPESRLRSIIDTMPAETKASEQNHAELSQSPQTEAKPRERYYRQVRADDIEYLSPREAARVIGLILELFDGNTVRPSETTAVETDLIWHRQGETVAVRIVPLSEGSVGTSHIQALAEGTVVPTDTRSPSQLVIVTNRGFTDEAMEAASEDDIHCLDGGQLEELLRRARIPMNAAGTVLEDGETHEGPMTDLVDVPSIPQPRRTENPLNVPPAFDISSLEVGDEQQNKRKSTPEGSREHGSHSRIDSRDNPLTGSQPAPGETGRLYADPAEDGDYSAFDDYLDDL